jgi:hypothetical protein
VGRLLTRQAGLRVEGSRRRVQASVDDVSVAGQRPGLRAIVEGARRPGVPELVGAERRRRIVGDALEQLAIRRRIRQMAWSVFEYVAQSTSGIAWVAPLAASHGLPSTPRRVSQRTRPHPRHPAERVGVHVSQIRRYEAGTSTPALDALRKLAIALSVSANTLVFDKDERGPDEDLRLQFEATARLTDDEKRVVKAVLESLLLTHDVKHDVNLWAA